MDSGLVITSELRPHHWGLQKTQGEIPRMQAGAQLLATMVPVSMATPASWDNLSENSSFGDSLPLFLTLSLSIRRDLNIVPLVAGCQTMAR